MKKSIRTIFAAVVSTIALASCEQEIADFTNRLDDLENRVSLSKSHRPIGNISSKWRNQLLLTAGRWLQ